MESERCGVGTGLAVIVLVTIVILVLASLGYPYFSEARHARALARSIRCRNNLNQIAKGMACYLNEYSDDRWYPFPLGKGLEPDDFSGAEWLATLYWTTILYDHGNFLCPGSGDTNHDGADLGSHRAVPGRFGSQTVSYAGMHYRSLTDSAGNPKPGAIPGGFAPHEPMACDDTEGTINHDDPTMRGMGVLFFDSHVEFWADTRIDLERGVGMKGGPLWRLRN